MRLKLTLVPYEEFIVKQKIALKLLKRKAAHHKKTMKARRKLEKAQLDEQVYDYMVARNDERMAIYNQLYGDM